MKKNNVKLDKFGQTAVDLTTSSLEEAQGKTNNVFNSHSEDPSHGVTV